MLLMMKFLSCIVVLILENTIVQGFYITDEAFKKQNKRIDDLVIKIDNVEHKVDDLSKKMEQVLKILQKKEINTDSKEALVVAEDALVVAGGNPDKTAVQVFHHGQHECHLPRLPDNRRFHTLDTVDGVLTVCGGINDVMGDWGRTLPCLKFVKGSWQEVEAPLMSRLEHFSWVTSQGLMLLGGTSEEDKDESTATTELVMATGSNPGVLIGWKFNLTRVLGSVCAITEQATLVVTGGLAWDVNSSPGGLQAYPFVTRYNEAGEARELAQLNNGRGGHGCGLIDIGGKKALVVAGGLGSPLPGHKWGLPLDSTELLWEDSNMWEMVGPLPSARMGLTGASLDGQLFMLGGSEGDRAPKVKEILTFDPKTKAWKKIQTIAGVDNHALTTAVFASFEEFCKNKNKNTLG